MYIGYQNGKIKFYTENKLDIKLYNIDKIESVDAEYVLDGDEYVIKDGAWLERQTLKEKERIANLKLTGADVEREIYQAKGMDFDDIIKMVENLIASDSETVQIDIKALKIELKANHFYRGNPYVEIIGNLLGYSSSDLDYLFEHKALPEKEVEDARMVL